MPTPVTTPGESSHAESGFVHSLDESFQDTLVPGALIVGFAYVVIGSIHAFVAPGLSPILGPIELATGLATLSLFFVVRNRRVEPGTARIIGALIVAPVLLNNALYLNLHPAAGHAFGLYILIVGIGMIPFTARWFASITGLALASFTLAALRSADPLEAWIEPSVTILAIAALGTAMHAWRFRYAQRMDSLQVEAARAHERRLRMETHHHEMTERANDMITELDARGTIIYANPAHEVVLGYKPEELIGRAGWRFVIGEDASLSDVLHGPPHRRVITVLHADGTERSLECNIRPFERHSGERRLVVTTRDVTERVASERALRADHDELESLVAERTDALQSTLHELQRSARLASMGTLAAGIAHQINNPIGSIQMSAELGLIASDDADGSKQMKEALENNLEQAKRCGQIVTSMLQFARNEPTTRSRQDLAAIVLRVCSQTERYARTRLAVIDTAGVDGPLPVVVSTIEIEQALLNIVRNATESATHSVHVRIEARAEDGFACVSVRDDGVGMAEAEVEHAFDPFFTTRLNRGGTGLGLSVAHGVVTDHSGTLSIESQAGVGTAVHIRLPLNLADVPID